MHRDQLTTEDRAFLDRRQLDYEVQRKGAELWIIIRSYELPEKYQPRTVEVLLRQYPGYPDTGMDMFWTRPTVTLVGSGQRPNAADVFDIPGGEWQRWSRHIERWRSGTDNLETYFAFVAKALS